MLEAADRGVPVHSDATPVEQDRPTDAFTDRTVDGPTDRRRQRAGSKFRSSLTWVRRTH